MLAWRLWRLASFVFSRWPYGHAMDSRCAALPLCKNDRGKGLHRFARMTKIYSEIASKAQVSTQAPHSMQESASLTVATESLISMTPIGQASMHDSQPVQTPLSIEIAMSCSLLLVPAVKRHRSVTLQNLLGKLYAKSNREVFVLDEHCFWHR
jgi:hypothetical protein